MGQTKIIRIPRPFTKGWVTDRPRWALDQQEMADGQDVFWPRGVAVKRRGWTYTQTASPLGTSVDLSGLMVVQFDPSASTTTYVVTDASGQVGIAGTATATTAFTGTSNVLYLPRAVWNGEVILCAQDGVSSMRRWAGVTTAPTASPAGTLTLIRDRTAVTGSSTAFTTAVAKNTYVKLRRKGSFGYSYRITDIASNTAMTLGAGPWTDSWPDRTSSRPTASSVAWFARNSGDIGLKALVTEMSTATLSGTSVTGFSTAWSSGAANNGVVAVGDIIGRKRDTDVSPAVDSTPDAGVISAVNSNTSLTLEYSPSASFTTVPYVILRAMPGKEACAHQGRLWFTGIKWDPNRIYVSPTQDRWPSLGSQANGEDSFDIDWANAAQAKFVDVPNRLAPGSIVALISGRNVLLVLRENNIYGIFGAWPGISVELIADGAGCVDIRSTSSSEEGQFWAGSEGIYHYEPGKGLRDLTLGKNNRLWRSLMYSRSSNAIVTTGVVNRHLVVSYNDGGNSQTWLYDLVADNWCGKLSGIRARAMHNLRVRNQPEDLLFLVEGEKRIGSLRSALRDEDPVPDVIVMGSTGFGARLGATPGVNEGHFYAESGSVPVDVATDSFRVTQMRVGYECVGGAGITVQTGDADTQRWNPHVTETLLEPTGYEVTTEKVRAKTSESSDAAIGREGRQFSVRVEEDSSEYPERLAIHELQIVAREFDQRD